MPLLAVVGLIAGAPDVALVAVVALLVDTGLVYVGRRRGWR
jgi:hypothetical protein